MHHIGHSSHSAKYFTHCMNCQTFLALYLPETRENCTFQTLVVGWHQVTSSSQ
jgi:hypothetical protein